MNVCSFSGLMEEGRGRISPGQSLDCSDKEPNSTRNTDSSGNSSELEKSLRRLWGNGTNCLKNPWLNQSLSTGYFFLLSLHLEMVLYFTMTWISETDVISLSACAHSVITHTTLSLLQKCFLFFCQYCEPANWQKTRFSSSVRTVKCVCVIRTKTICGVLQGIWKSWGHFVFGLWRGRGNWRLKPLHFVWQGTHSLPYSFTYLSFI